MQCFEMTWFTFTGSSAQAQRPEVFLLCTTVKFNNAAGFDLQAGGNLKGVASLYQLTSAACAAFPRQKYISGYPVPGRN